MHGSTGTGMDTYQTVTGSPDLGSDDYGENGPPAVYFNIGVSNHKKGRIDEAIAQLAGSSCCRLLPPDPLPDGSPRPCDEEALRDVVRHP